MLPTVEISHIRRHVDHLAAFEQVKYDMTDWAAETHLPRALTFFARRARDKEPGDVEISKHEFDLKGASIGTFTSEILNEEQVVRRVRSAA